MSEARPRVRPYLDARPALLETPRGREPIFVIKDPFKLADGLGVPQAVIALLGLLDGTRTLPAVQAELARRHGAVVPLDLLGEHVAALEEALLLDGPRVAAALDAFRAEPVRPPACIGSYPGDPAALREFLDAQWTRAGGPGAPPGPRRGAPIRGVISPHIDLHRGGHAYAHAWRAVAEACPARLFVVFGTSHTGTGAISSFGSPGPAPRFALTRKTFDTPLGPVPTDQAALDRLLAAYDGPDDLFAGELHHRGEHSIEFQAVWLRHLGRDVAILPVLCGGLHDLEGDPRADPGLVAFHAALRAALAPLPPDEVAFVAGIDLAHVGAQFRNPPVDEADVAAVERADRVTLGLALERRCPDLVHRDIRKDGDARSICGHAPLVALLQALEGERLQGELLTWDRWWDGESAVSFAAAVLRAGEPCASTT